jgi:very-short-patch-repair endonuclease
LFAAPERALWARLRGHRLGSLKFRRQHPIGLFIADFACIKHRLVVEIDGSTHLANTEYDTLRTRWLSGRRWRVLRFTNRQVIRNMDGVLEVIRAACGRSPVGVPSPQPLSTHEAAP